MTRRLALLALLLLAPLSAYAQGISVVEVTQVTSSGGDINFLRDGDILTVDLVLSNPDATDVFGLGLDVRGYDADANGIADDGLSFLGGTAADEVFSTAFVPGTGSLGGLSNIRAGDVVEKGNPFIPAQCNPTICTPVDIEAVELHGVYMEGAALEPSNGSGILDTGIGGDLVGNGDVHFQVMFEAVTNGVLSVPTAMTLDFGTRAAALQQRFDQLHAGSGAGHGHALRSRPRRSRFDSSSLANREVPSSGSSRPRARTAGRAEIHGRSLLLERAAVFVGAFVLESARSPLRPARDERVSRTRASGLT
jgi:hypothetical protein